MSHDDNQCRLGRFEFGIVKRKVKQIIGRSGYTRQDTEDLEQDLLTRLMQGLKSFDPDVAHRKSFVTAIVERSVASIIRDAEAQKRDHRRIGSLQLLVQVTEEGPIELVQTLSDREHNNRHCRDPRNDENLTHLVTDLAAVVDSLPDELRDLAERLKTQSISAIAREIGVPRTTLNDTVRRLRHRFEAAGLRDYV